MSDINPWQPATAAQRMALDCEADLLLFGGSAGSLKSHTLLLDAMQERENPNFRGIIFRRTFDELSELIDKCYRLYQPLGAQYNDQKKTWRWPSGATLRGAYMEQDRDVYRHWGKEHSWIGFDESTLHTEFQIRTILTRLRTVHSGLKCRARLATNPGGPGASFQQQIFLNGACPVHQPELCSVPGKLYTGRKWPSDGKLIPFSVAFIPGKLSDHNLLGDKYVEQLRMQKGALADQLEIGCWCELSGAYFAKVWDRNRCIVPYDSIEQRHWYQYWIALDYGYGKSSAAATLFMKQPPSERFPDGRIFLLNEMCLADTSADDFAQQVVASFVEPTVRDHRGEDQRRTFAIVFADPANFNPDYDIRHGTAGHSVADQIDEVLRPHHLSCSKASNDRIGGWQLLYKMLKTGAFVISDKCPMSAESIRSRVHDELRPGDVLKVKGDPLDDLGDSVRYGLYSFINQPRKPVAERLQEAAAKYDEADVTSRIIAMKQEEAKIIEENRPLLFGGTPRQRLQQMARRGRRF